MAKIKLGGGFIVAQDNTYNLEALGVTIVPVSTRKLEVNMTCNFADTCGRFVAIGRNTIVWMEAKEYELWLRSICNQKGK